MEIRRLHSSKFWSIDLAQLIYDDWEHFWDPIHAAVDLFFKSKSYRRRIYSGDQIYNADECGLWWKIAPTRTINFKTS